VVYNKQSAAVFSHCFWTHRVCVCVCLASAVTEEFHYDLVYMTDEACEDIEPAVAIQLSHQHRDSTSGLVCLAFDVVFAPYKPMSYVTSRWVHHFN